MRWIKRCCLWFVLPICGLLLLLPGLIGWLLARSYPTSLEAIAFQLPRHQLQSTEIERGWFRSQARSRWRAIDDGTPVTTQSQLHHGPLVFAGQGLQFAWWSEALTLNAFDQPSLRANYQTSLLGLLSGDWEGTLTQQPVLVSGHGELQYRFGRGSADTRFVLDKVAGWIPSGHITSSLNGQLTIDDQQFVLSLQAPASQIDDRSIARGTQLELALNAQQEQGSGQAVMNIEALDWANWQFNAVTADLEIERLDLPTLTTLWQQWQSLNQTPSSTNIQTGQIQAQLLLALPTLLQHQPTLALREFKLVTPNGPTFAEAQLRFPQGISPAELIDPSRLLNAVDGFVRGELPRADLHRWVTRTAGQQQPWLSPTELQQLANEWIAGYITTQWLTPDRDQLRFDWRLQDGTLQVNGHAKLLNF